MSRRTIPSEALPTIRTGNHVIDLTAKTVRGAESPDGREDPGADIHLTPTE